MIDDVKLYVSTYETCNRFKSSSLKKNGQLMPIPAPAECWHTVSIDWIMLSLLRFCVSIYSNRDTLVPDLTRNRLVSNQRLVYYSYN
jgi:hypothetical protein